MLLGTNQQMPKKITSKQKDYIPLYSHCARSKYRANDIQFASNQNCKEIVLFTDYNNNKDNSNNNNNNFIVYCMCAVRNTRHI